MGEVKTGTDQPHGMGIMVTDTGIVDEGFWKDGMKHGRGRSMNCHGDWSFGEYKDDTNHGKWTCYYAEEDGNVEEVGKWENGVKVGTFVLTMPNGDIQEVQYDN